jgi:anti-anti-sigma regulatory factor
MEAATKIGVGRQSPGEDVTPGQESRQLQNKLPAVLGLTEAQSLRDTLAALLGGGSLLLDASAVERMSTPCAQVLLAAGRQAFQELSGKNEKSA